MLAKEKEKSTIDIYSALDTEIWVVVKADLELLDKIE
jgi:hypothetical protein